MINKQYLKEQQLEKNSKQTNYQELVNAILKPPSKISCEYLYKNCDIYIKNRLNNGILPTIMGLKNYLNINKDKIIYWKKSKKKLYKIWKHFDKLMYSLWVERLARDTKGVEKYLNVVHKFKEENETLINPNQYLAPIIYSPELDAKLQQEHLQRIKAMSEPNKKDNE